MLLSTFLAFLAFLTRKLRWSRANQETLPEIRREALGRRLAAEQTRSLLDGLVRARLIEAGDDGWPRYPSVAGQPTTFFRTNARKARKVRKGATLTTFLTFLTIVAPKPCFPAPVTSYTTGLVWLLRSRSVVALTEFTTAIQAGNRCRHDLSAAQQPCTRSGVIGAVLDKILLAGREGGL
jgi:hypothetical protein